MCLQAVRSLQSGSLGHAFPLWQVRLVLERVGRATQGGGATQEAGPYSILLSSEFLSVIHSMADITMETWLRGKRGGRLIVVDSQPDPAVHVVSETGPSH